MNYRHAFHAGNFADVLKHAVLARILAYLVEKPAPVRFIDTHAGIGRYDLAGPEASRTGEWRLGIARVLKAERSDDLQRLLAPYLLAVGPATPEGRPLSYPGSPALAQHILRPIDRILLSELHDVDAAELRAEMRQDRRVKVLAVDGYRALKAALPPPERRGLVLIDPPYEDGAEFDHLLAAFHEAYRRWPTGLYALWYPIKTGAPAADFLRGLHAQGVSKHLEAELTADTAPLREGGLRGSGLVIVNPPYTLKREADLILPHLAACLSNGESVWRWRVDGSVP